ncbi:TlpA family protein disulfide reductase [Kitasatospora sp. NPDC101801]|uniref:TlpA family protein disulfide reductase n=1 Tax=Kitasatospora sp. NPDC101801 TaxID=3364103 RepID=UPI0037FD51A9
MSVSLARAPRFRPAALVTAVVAVIALAGCSGAGSGAGGAGDFVSGGHGVDTVAVAARRAAPAIAGTDLSGRQTALSDYPGKVVVINIWGSWCTGCRAEAKGLEQVHQKYKDQDVQFLGINTSDADVSNARRFEETNGITYPSLYDPDGTQLLKFPKGTFNPQTLPSTIVVDRQGRLAARTMNVVSADTLESMLAPVLAEAHS